MNKQFWVVGGEYTDTAFQTLVLGSEYLVGPFDNRDSAMRKWQEVAARTRSTCLARFTIVGDTPAL